MLLQNQRWRDFADGHSGPMLSYASTLPYVTSNAAASLGLGDEIGRLAPGRKADIILINTADPALAPATDAVLALLTAPASAIDTVLVDGHVVKRNGALNAGNLGWLRDAARQARNRLLSSV
jgi:cytosine/adenosine deaminase-related metal-dependent hydrolase